MSLFLSSVSLYVKHISHSPSGNCFPPAAELLRLGVLSWGVANVVADWGDTPAIASSVTPTLLGIIRGSTCGIQDGPSSTKVACSHLQANNQERVSAYKCEVKQKRSSRDCMRVHHRKMWAPFSLQVGGFAQRISHHHEFLPQQSNKGHKCAVDCTLGSQSFTQN